MTSKPTKLFKDTIIGGISIAIAQFLWGFNEAVIKMFEIKILQLCIIAFAVHLLCATIWWNVRKPLTTYHWYGDTKKDQINIWLRGCLQSLIFLFWYACIRLPLGDM